MKKVFIITGEHSGDIHASNVIKKLKQINPEIIIEGIGASAMESTGINLFANHDKDKMSAVGLSPVIIYNHLMLGKKLVKYLKTVYKPDLVLLVDYGTFNLSIAKVLRGSGIKIFYYIPPQIWASRAYRINLIKKYVDKVLCIFPFEQKLYKNAGVDCHYCGHPLITQIPFPPSQREVFNKYGLDSNKKLVSVFPGSRVFELKNLMKPFLESVEILKHKHPDLQFCISQASNISDDVFAKYLGNYDIKVVKGDNYSLLSASNALILASGTVALEACLYKTPMIIAYRGPKLFYWIYLLVRCIEKVSLPNIIANKLIVPEIIQGNVTPEKISYEIEELLYNQEKRETTKNDLAKVKELLSPKNAAFEVAKEIDRAL